MKKLFLIVVVVVILGLAGFSGFVSIKGFANYEAPKQLPTISQLEERLNQNISLERLGLFYYQNGVAVSVREDNLNINNKKPVVIFTHGMLSGEGYNINYNFKERQPWIDAGYNVFLFRWTQFADQPDPVALENKEWVGGEHMVFAYKNEKGKRVVETKNLPEYSLAEIFGIYYNEMMTKYNMQTSDIRFIGHSMGGQMSMAIASYIKTMVDKGVINKRYMLSRVTMLDPYVGSIPNEEKVSWLNREIGTNASLIIDILKDFREDGIPVEYIRSGLADIGLFDEEQREGIRKNSIFIELDWSYLIGGFAEVVADRHQVAVDWYNQSISYTFMDKTTENNELGVAASTPNDYAVALYGSMFQMEETLTEGLHDDIIYSTGRQNSVICGYAFYDENRNGLNDDTYKNKRKGVQVNLYCGNKRIDTVYTSRGGYYSFELDDSYVGKELYIKVPFIKPTIMAKGEGNYLFSGNGISKNKKSKKIVLNNDKEIHIINIGLA